MANDELKKLPLEKSDYFTFHVIQDHNFEDTYPYIDDDLLVVCDGCGGAGSSKHTLYKRDVDSYEKIRNIVLPEDKDGLLKDYMMHGNVFYPVVNSKEDTQIRTSAFIGSRTVMSRFVYAYKTIPDHDPEEIRDFIIEGMKEVIECLGLEDTKKVDKALLSTTFVGVTINGETEDKVDVDVYWAGDSRAYYLSRNGLQQLSKDDEDESGALTNLYCIAPKVTTKVNHLHHVLDKPCVILTCSDGLFDALHDSLEVENTLLHFLCVGDSMESWRDGLIAFYDQIKCDDTTVALRQFGFKDYEEMKNALKPRLEEVEDLYRDKVKYSLAYNLRNDSSEYDDALRILTDVVEQKHEEIINNLAFTYKTNPNDPFIKKFLLDELEEQNGTNRKVSGKKILDLLNDAPQKEDAELLRKGYEKVKQIVELKAPEEMDEETIKAFDFVLLISKRYLLLYKKRMISQQIYNLLFDAYVNSATLLQKKPDFENVIGPEEFIEDLCSKHILPEHVVKFLAPVQDGEAMKEEFNEIDNKLQELDDDKFSKLKDISLSLLLNQINEAFLAFVKHIEDEQIIGYLDYESLNIQDIIRVAQESEGKTTDLRSLIAEMYDDKEGYKLLVSQRVSLLEKECSFDVYFNPSFLKNAINYEKAKSLNKDEVDAFIKAYDDYEKNINAKIEE